MTGSKRERILVCAGLVWLSPTAVLIQRRSPRAAHGAAMLELVGGKIAVGEAPPRALQRELIEEWGPRAAALVVGPIADVLHHIYPAGGPEVILCVYHVDARAWGTGYRSFVEPEPDAIVSAFAVGELPVDEFLAADRALVDRVRTKAIACPWSS